METLKTFFKKAPASKSCKSRQDKFDAVALVQCGCDIAPAGTRERDCHFFGDVVARGFAPVKFVLFAQIVYVIVAVGRS